MINQLDLMPISDIYTAAFLLCRGEKYHHIQRNTNDGRLRVVFYFPSKAEELIDEYFNGARCSAIAFKNAVENCKNLIYDFNLISSELSFVRIQSPMIL